MPAECREVRQPSLARPTGNCLGVDAEQLGYLGRGEDALGRNGHMTSVAHTVCYRHVLGSARVS